MSIWDYITPFGGNAINSFFHPERAYKKSRKEYEKYYNQGQGQLNPYNQLGQNQGNVLTNAQNELLNPQTLLNKWLADYQESPYAKQSFENAKAGGLDAASAQGLLGSNAATQNIENSAGEIMQKDRNQYLEDLMNKYLTGIGIGKDIYGTGANAASQQARNAIEAGQNEAGFKYGEYQAPGNLLERLISQGIQLYTGGMGGGGGFNGGGFRGAPGQYGGNINQWASTPSQIGIAA